MHKYATPVTDRLVRAYFIAPIPPIERFEWTPTVRYVRPGGDDRGNARDRRVRKQWLLDAFGDGDHVACRHCWHTLTYATLTVDRITPGHVGGRYVRGNIRPSCARCAHGQGGTVRWEIERQGS